MDATGVPTEFNINDAIAITIEILKESRSADLPNILSASKEDTQAQRYTQEKVARMSAALFGPETGSEVERFIEGAHKTTSDILLHSQVGVPDRLRDKVQLENELITHHAADQKWRSSIQEHRTLFRNCEIEAGGSLDERDEQLQKQTLKRRMAYLNDAAPILSMQSVSAMQALCDLAPPNLANAPFDGYIIPPGTDLYTFTITSDSLPSMILDGVPVEFTEKPLPRPAWLSKEKLRLAGDQWYSLQLSGCSPADLNYTAGQGLPSGDLSSMLIDRGSVEMVSKILVKLTRSAIPVSLSGLQREEVQYFQSLDGFDFGALTLANLSLLRAYTELRNSLPKPQGKDALFPLITLYKSLDIWDSSQSLVTQLVLITGWPKDKIQAVLAAKYPSLTEMQLVSIFQDVTALCELRDTVEFISRLRLQGASAKLLFSLAEPALPKDYARTSENTSRGNSGTTSPSGGQSGQNSEGNSGTTSPSGGQSGQNSQGNSGTSTPIIRCHSLLYPESWIDPTLRDDKSEQFRALESAITQGKLTEESISGAVKDYIYATNGVGNLEIQAYLWDRDVFNKRSNSGCYILPVILGGRLFLFLPHFTLSDIFDSGTKDMTFRNMADKEASAPTKQKQWQMPSSEQNIANNLVARLPSIQTFKFWVSSRQVQQTTTDMAQDVLVMDVERWIDPVNPSFPVFNNYYNRFYAYKLGTFEWRDERIVLLDSSSINNTWKWPSIIPTNFMKLAWWVSKGGTYPVPQNQISGMTPLLAGRPSPTENSVYSFALSFNTISVGIPSGFVIDISTANRIQSVIGCPPSDAIYTTSNYEMGRFYNAVSPLLLQAAGSGMAEIYTALLNIPLGLYIDAFGKRKRTIPHELANPYSLYTWETAVHVISLVIKRLLSTQQYKLALAVARLLFDPVAIGANSDVTKC
ncbi:hypothetical protein G7Y89_g15349 [Cudoniella acicularis]|uniref:Uncharacterized protein n=1 Tax=Cudoniella acicularis TaxID=354080 RepID=A0A8H4QNM6_9HELO|nr:hypothetical protein G7Y89_g15349 [Cudoniella acicularis]